MKHAVIRNGECIAKYIGSDHNFPELGNPGKQKIFKFLVHNIDILTKGNFYKFSCRHILI